jgi:hypothetical protein
MFMYVSNTHDSQVYIHKILGIKCLNLVLGIKYQIFIDAIKRSKNSNLQKAKYQKHRL